MDSEPEEAYDHLHRYAYDEMTSRHDKNQASYHG